MPIVNPTQKNQDKYKYSIENTLKQNKTNKQIKTELKKKKSKKWGKKKEECPKGTLAVYTQLKNQWA